MARPTYIWDGSQWVAIQSSESKNGLGVPSGGNTGQYLKNGLFWSDIPISTTSQSGLVQLTDSISSTSTTTAITPNAVKTAYDSLILDTIIDAKGDLIVGSANDTPVKLTAGTNGEVLISNSIQSNGLSWIKQPILFMSMASGQSYTLSLTSGITFTAVQNTTYYSPLFIPNTVTLDQFKIRTASTFSGTSVVRLGIYSSSNGKPSTLILDAGTVSCTAASTTYTLSMSQQLTPGWYWLAANSQTAATTNSFLFHSNTSTRQYQDLGFPYVEGNNIFFGFIETGITGAFANAGTLTRGNAMRITVRVA